jgi:ATP synthase protein I
LQVLKTADVFRQMVKWQILATSAVALMAYFLAGLHGTLSALAGGGAAVIGGFAASCVAKRSDQKKQADAILINLLKAEASKILVIVLLLWVTFKLYTNIVPLALIVGLAAAALLSGAAFFALNEKSDN